jgi:hypothetical protein
MVYRKDLIGERSRLESSSNPDENSIREDGTRSLPTVPRQARDPTDGNDEASSDDLREV